MPDSGLPFTIEPGPADRWGTVLFVALVNGKQITCERYKPGDGDRRRKVAQLWAQDERLRNGRVLIEADIVPALEAAERNAMNATQSEADEVNLDGDDVKAASFVDDDLIVELAWNLEAGSPDFIVYDRATREVTRSDRVETPIGTLTVPAICKGVVTPGGSVQGTVYVPTAWDETGVDEVMLRASVRAFVHRYVELSDAKECIVVEYIFLTWVHDGFDELPYLAFRTTDVGRGKSRALETVGALCYRPIFCGGGSTAAATLRLIDVFGGTLVADEYDQRDTELAAELTRILNQGFQRNRPLVKCDGESNTPRPFRCFGPKLFALRKGFADDATETRTLSIRMQQRTRDDIPINLPRKQFDREALTLRNRLLAWRFANLGRITIDPALADHRLEDRCNQIGLPLLAVARNDEARKRIVEALLGQQADVAADRGDSFAAEVFETALRIAKPGDIVRPIEVTNEINRRRAEVEGFRDGHGNVDVSKLRKPVKPGSVGAVMFRDLELPREPRDKAGVRYKLDPIRVVQLRRRFGMDSDPPNGSGDGPGTPSDGSSGGGCSDRALPTPPTPTPARTPENQLFHSASGIGVGCVDGVGSGEGGGSVRSDPASADAPVEQVGLVPDGWTPESWADRLDQLAES